jgi:tetratricopeptide (TPR) repeat protein
MRIRSHHLRCIAGALFCLTPLAARAQTDTLLKLSTTVPQAATDFRAGVTDLENFSIESGESHFQSAVKADPNFGLARAMSGFMGAALTGDLTQDQALSEINRGIGDAAAHGTTNELLLAAVYREALLNHTDAAAALFRAASQLMPNDRILAANAAGFAGDPNNPVPVMRDFIAKNPNYAPAYNTYAYNLWTHGDRAGALQAAKRQTELNPNAPNPFDTYGEILQWNGNFPEATVAYRRATTTSPRFPDAYAGLAEVEALQGHYDQARSFLNQAITNAWTPQQRLSYMRQIAGTYALQGGPPDAVAKQLQAVAAEATTQNNPTVAAIANAQVAAAYANAGNVDAAHKQIAAAKAASADVPWQVNYYAATAHGLMKHWAPANQELAALKTKASTGPAPAKTMAAAAEGFLLTQQGRPADALKILSASDTTNILVMNRIAEAHQALGHSPEAAAWRNKITNNRALNLLDFPAANARRRTRVASSSTRTP